MTISVIIVNYNVKYFLEQCLFSVQAALKNIPGEIIVVDNASKDKSIDYLQPKFPFVKFIVNPRNRGFGTGCNDGFKLSSGEFVLFLNPDCIIPEDCFDKSISFLNNHPEAGALGVKMFDGSGKFLKESKRSFPALSTSFFKMVGLAALFPHSKFFAKYYLGQLDENKNHEIGVLAGAFMLMRRNVFEKVNGFDEDFFMYGEDIDLSYRIHKAGFKNYYFSETAIIHFKGEGTKKGNLNYVQMFYNAMSIFVHKHYKDSLYKLFIHSGIWLAALFSSIANAIKSLFSFLHTKSNKVIESIAIIGNEEEYQSALSLIKKIQPGKTTAPRITLDKLQKIDEHSFNTVIVCAGTLSYKKIIELMREEGEKISIKVHATGSNSIVGSSSKDKPGDAIGLE